MDSLELTILGPAPGTPMESPGGGWIDPAEACRKPRWVLLDGVEADA
jgi:hypothetical protein